MIVNTDCETDGSFYSTNQERVHTVRGGDGDSFTPDIQTAADQTLTQTPAAESPVWPRLCALCLQLRNEDK